METLNEKFNKFDNESQLVIKDYQDRTKKCMNCGDRAGAKDIALEQSGYVKCLNRVWAIFDKEKRK